jgi:hypothetical protein
MAIFSLEWWDPQPATVYFPSTQMTVGPLLLGFVAVDLFGLVAAGRELLEKWETSETETSIGKLTILLILEALYLERLITILAHQCGTSYGVPQTCVGNSHCHNFFQVVINNKCIHDI